LGALLITTAAMFGVNAVVFGLYFLGAYNQTAGISVAAAIVGIPLVREIYIHWKQQSERLTKVYVAQNDLHEAFYDVQEAISTKDKPVVAEEMKESPHIVKRKRLMSEQSALSGPGSGSLIGFERSYQNASPAGSLYKGSGTSRPENSRLSLPSMMIVGPPVRPDISAKGGDAVALDRTAQRMLEKYSAVFGDSRTHAGGEPSLSAVPAYSAAGGAAAFLVERQNKKQRQLERERKKAAEYDYANNSFASYASSLGADFNYQLPAPAGYAEETKTHLAETVGRVGNVGIAGTGLVTFNQGSWYNPNEGEGDTADEEDAALSAKLDEVSLAEPSLASYDSPQLGLGYEGSTTGDLAGRGGSITGGRLSSQLRRMLDRASQGVLSVAKASRGRVTPQFENTPYEAGRYDAREPAQNAHSPQVQRTRPLSRAPSPGSRDYPDRHQLPSREQETPQAPRRPPTSSAGPARDGLVPAAVAVNRLQRMQRRHNTRYRLPTSDAEFQSMRRVRQMSRKLLQPDADVGYAFPELVAASHLGEGPGAQAQSVTRAPHGRSDEAAAVSSPVHWQEESGQFRAYMVTAADEKLPAVDILSRAEHRPLQPTANSADARTGRTATAHRHAVMIRAQRHAVSHDVSLYDHNNNHADTTATALESDSNLGHPEHHALRTPMHSGPLRAAAPSTRHHSAEGFTPAGRRVKRRAAQLEPAPRGPGLGL
jgi:hypothetical protein